MYHMDSPVVEPTLTAVSVVIPARNEAPRLTRCISSVRRAMTESNARGEIVVVDDASTDETAEVARNSGATVLRHEVRHGPLTCWNDGVQATTAPFIIFVDADCTVEPTAFRHMLRAFTDGRIGIVAARSTPGIGQSNQHTRGFAYHSACFSATILDSLKRRVSNHDYQPIGRLMAVRRAAWNLESTVGAPCDREVAFLAKIAGWQIVYEPNAIVYYKPIEHYKQIRADYLRTVLRTQLQRSYDPIPRLVLLRAAVAATLDQPIGAAAWICCRLRLWADRMTGHLGATDISIRYWGEPPA